MSGISIVTAVEIFTNPGDLEITIAQEFPQGKFAICIFRGPGHNFKPLITSPPFAVKFEDAVEAVEERLIAIHQEMTIELKEPSSHLIHWLNPRAMKIDELKILDPELIKKIIDELRRNKSVSTYKLLQSAS